MKRINTILAIAMTLVLSLGLTGCGKSSPKDVAKEAVEAQLKGDLQAFYNLLCEADQTAMTYDNFITKYTLPRDAQALFDLVPETRDVLKAGSFKEIVNGESATVTYVLTCLLYTSPSPRDRTGHLVCRLLLEKKKKK